MALMRTDFPITDGSPPKSRRQSCSLSTTTFGAPCLIFALVEESAGERLDAQAGRNQFAPTRTPCTRSASVSSRMRFAVVPSMHREADEVRRARAIVDEVHRRAGVAVSLLRVHDAHEAVGLRKRQRLEQHAVHDAEDRRVGADAERERDDRGEREGRRRAELSRGVADVVPEVVHEVAPPLRGFDVAIDRADIAACVVQISEFADGLRARGVAAMRRARRAVDAHVEVKAELFVDVVADLPRRCATEVERGAFGGRSRRLQHLEHRFGVSAPGGFFGLELAAAGGGERVVARAPVVLGQSPLGGDEAGALEAMECFVEGRVFDFEDAVGALVDPSRDGVAVHRAPGERSEHEDVERALEQVHRLCGHSSVSPYQVRGRSAFRRLASSVVG